MVRQMAQPHKTVDLGDESLTFGLASETVLTEARHKGRIQACSVRIFRYIRLKGKALILQAHRGVSPRGEFVGNRPQGLIVLRRRREPGRRLPNLLDCGEKQPDQDRNDSDHHEQLDEGEACSTSHSNPGFHSLPPLKWCELLRVVTGLPGLPDGADSPTRGDNGKRNRAV